MVGFWWWALWQKVLCEISHEIEINNEITRFKRKAMSPEVVVEIFRSALYIIIILVAASIIPGLLVGLLVAVFQAATSINEQTLSFLPRLLVTLATLMFLANWIFSTLIEFAKALYLSIPELIG